MSLREYFESDLDYFAWKLEHSSENGTYFEHNGNTYILRRTFSEHSRTYARNESPFNKWCEEHFSEEELRPASTKRSEELIMSKCPELSKEQASLLDFKLDFGAYQKYRITNMTFLNMFYISKNNKEIVYGYLPTGDYNKFHTNLMEWIEFAIDYLDK